MNEENTKHLFEKYPKIFANKDKSMQESCMHWGFECGDGWFEILDLMCRKIQYHVDNPQWISTNSAYNRIKGIYNKTLWNHVFSPIGSLFLRGVPRSYLSIEGNKYAKKWKCYNRWQRIFMASPPKYRKPPFDPNRQVVANQVKEKFGTLRFYYSGGDDFVQGVVSMAESMSALTCEACGSMDKTVKPNPGSWIAIRCDKCRKKKKK